MENTTNLIHLALMEWLCDHSLATYWSLSTRDRRIVQNMAANISKPILGYVDTPDINMFNCVWEKVEYPVHFMIIFQRVLDKWPDIPVYVTDGQWYLYNN